MKLPIIFTSDFFPHLLPERKCEYKNDSMGKDIKRNSHACETTQQP